MVSESPIEISKGALFSPPLSHHLFWWLRHLNIWSHWKLLYATLLYDYETVPKLNLFLNLKWVDGDLSFTQIISREKILRVKIRDAQNFSENAVRNPSFSIPGLFTASQNLCKGQGKCPSQFYFIELRQSPPPAFLLLHPEPKRYRFSTCFMFICLLLGQEYQ